MRPAWPLVVLFTFCSCAGGGTGLPDAGDGGEDASGNDGSGTDGDAPGDPGDPEADAGDDAGSPADDGRVEDEPVEADGGDPTGGDPGEEEDAGTDGAADPDDPPVFAEDPIVFVHGYAMGPWEWATMMDRFRQLGYPDDYLNAIAFTSATQSNVICARDELPPYVEEVLARTGAEKVDIIAHSNGGMSSRLWIKFHGGQDKVRDYVSLSGTHHGTYTACLGDWLGECALEQCPPYAGEEDSYNQVQWLLNGDPDLDDVDETPFGAEDGGGIHYHALWTEDDLVDLPPSTCCLNQKSRGDCTDPVNIMFSGVGHIEMASDEDVFQRTQELVRAHNPLHP